MKNHHSTIFHRLLVALALLLPAAPGARAQGGTTARPDNASLAGSTTGPASGPAAGVLISNKIQFHGQVGGTQMNARFDPLDVCPNVVDPIGHGIQSQPYQFEFESNCSGNSNSWNCRFRPNFIWTVKYFTEGGNYYQEKWQDVTAGDFSKVRLYLYDRVPYPATQFMAATPTSGQATQAGGNRGFSAVPYPNLGCITAPTNTAQAGELITRMQLECTGYSCGFTQGDDSDVIQIRYYARRPEAIAVNGQTPLCRNTTYPISVSSVFAATNYVWYTAGLNGAVISAVNGTNATLNVSGVPAGTSSITLRVAAQDNAHCGGITSAVRELVVNIAQALPAPQNVQLSNGRCPTVGSSDFKQLSVDAVPGATTSTVYDWELVNNTAGAVFQNGTSRCDGCAKSLPISTPSSGQFTTMVKAKVPSVCGGLTATQTQAFTINSSLPTCPTAVTFPNGFCLGGNTYTMSLKDPEQGAIYSIAVNNVQPAGASVNFVQAANGQPYGSIKVQSGTPSSFDVSVFVVGSCPPITAINCAPIHLTYDAWCYQPPVGGGTSPIPQRSNSTTTLYPNPTSGQVAVQSSEPVRYEWAKVTDAQGRVIVEQRATTEEGVTHFDLSKAPTGIYEVQLFDGKQLTRKRITKE